MERQEAVAVREITPGVITDFVTWIDRGECTTVTYLRELKQFFAWMRYADITAPQRADIIAYRDWLQTEHDAISYAPDSPTGWAYRINAQGKPFTVKCAAGTVMQYLRMVKQFFTWTSAEGIYPNVAANIHPPKVARGVHRKDALTPAEMLAVENSIVETARQKVAERSPGWAAAATETGLRLYAMYLLAINAGLRTVEISRANVGDLEEKSGVTSLYVWGKGHSEPDQKKPLAPEVADAIHAYLKARKTPATKTSPLFVTCAAAGHRLTANYISRKLKGAMQTAGFDSPRLTAHSLRHSCGTAVMAMTGNLYATQTYMRHSNPATTEIYLHTDLEAQDAETARQLYAMYHGESMDELEQLTSRMTPSQIRKLAGIAAAML